MFYAVIAFVVVTGATIGVAFLAELWDPVARRLRGLDAPSAAAAGMPSLLRWDESPGSGSWWRRIVERLGSLLLGRAPGVREARQSAVRRRLVWAGYNNPRDVMIFLGAKVALAGGFAYSYTLYGVLIHRVLPQVILVSVIMGAIGFFLPDFWLSGRVSRRQREVQNALPDVLDLLVVCVEAGLGLDAAIAKVTDPDMGKNTPLHQELRRVHLEFRAGRPRDEALRALGERTGVDEVRMVVGAFAQTERLGTSLGNTLRVHADATRVKRRHRVEKAAYMAPFKMLFPITCFLFPASFVVVLAPPFFRIIETLRGLTY